jgi:hypothetical protein
MNERPTRRGFLAVCSAAAAALGLTARARPAKSPIAAVPAGDTFDGPAHSHYLGPAYKAGEDLEADDYCYIKGDGLVYTSRPIVSFLGGGGSPATASMTSSGIQVRTR